MTVKDVKDRGRLRCLVTGCRGLLGTELVAALKSAGHQVVGWDLPEHDITDVEATISAMHSVAPAVVFHLAAWTDVDGCELDAARANAVNFQGTWAVALGAAELRCRMVFVSTDYVFDGQSRVPYREKDRPNPISVYGRSKLMGEQAVVRVCRDYCIVRTSWLFGSGGRNFVDTIMARAAIEPEIRVVDDQVGSPTSAADLAPALVQVGFSRQRGIYHVTNAGQCSWYELARAVVELCRLNCVVKPQSSAQAGRPARRPAFSVLDNNRFRRKFGWSLRPWREALADYVATKTATGTCG